MWGNGSFSGRQLCSPLYHQRYGSFFWYDWKLLRRLDSSQQCDVQTVLVLTQWFASNVIESRHSPHRGCTLKCAGLLGDVLFWSLTKESHSSNIPLSDGLNKSIIQKYPQLVNRSVSITTPDHTHLIISQPSVPTRGPGVSALGWCKCSNIDCGDARLNIAVL